jgi:chitinase
MRLFSLKPVIIISVLMVLMSCGGGGGGGGGVNSGGNSPGVSGITYDGLVTQATISVANANTVFATVWNIGDSSSLLTADSSSLSIASLAKSPKDSKTVALFKQVKGEAMSAIRGFSARSNKTVTEAAINDTRPGSVSGTLTITGNIDPNTGTGSLTMVYSNYNDGDGITYDGTVFVSVAGFDSNSGIITDGTLSFTLCKIVTTASDISLTGSIRQQEDLRNNIETMTLNMDGRDNRTHDTFRYQNFIVKTIYDNIYAPTTMTETDTGRIYLARYGYVYVTTTTPLMYTSSSQVNPIGGGPIILSGASGSKTAISPISTSSVKIEVDANGDGVYEIRNTYAWSNLTGTRTTNDPPVAHAGPNQSVDVETLVTLDGSGSSDPNGDTLTYSWTMQTPWNSTAVLSDSHAAKPTFTPNVPGAYIFYLTVSDGYIGSTSSVVVSVSLTAVANAGSNQYKTTGPSTIITLDGSGSYDKAGRPMTYAWSLTRKPQFSTATLSDPSSVHPTFTADLEGKYELSLQIFYNGWAISLPATTIVVVITNRPIVPLPFKVIDAEYSQPLDRIIMVSGTPSNQLHIYDPVANVDQTVNLSALPQCVSVSPDGLYAAVGHNGTISYVDLASKAVVKTLATGGGDIADIVLAGNGYVYALQNPFIGVNINTGAVTAWNNGAGIKARLHPSGTVLYTTVGYAALKFDISSGPPVYLYSSDNIPGLHYNVGNDIWITADGTSLITQSSNIYSASSGSTNDMMAPKSNIGLQSQYVSDSAAAAQLALIPLPQVYYNMHIDDAELWMFDQYIGFLKSTVLPHFMNGGSDYLGHGKFVFYNSSGTDMYVIMQADAASGLVNDFGMVKY